MQCFASPCTASGSKSPVAPSTSSRCWSSWCCSVFILGFGSCLRLLEKTPHDSLRSGTWLILYRCDKAGHRHEKTSAFGPRVHVRVNRMCPTLLPKPPVKEPKHPSLWPWKLNERFNRKWEMRLLHVSTHAGHEPGTSPHQCDHSVFLLLCWVLQGPDHNLLRDLPKLLRSVDQTCLLHMW